MLLRFEVANHRSVNDPVELSMIAVDEDRPAARSFDLLNEKVLTVAGLYGPNASGKSTILDALAWLSEAVGTSLRDWEERVPREPFGDSSRTPSTYGVDMMVDGVRYAYSLTVSDDEVLHESLDSYPERRRRSHFEREGMDIGFRRGTGAAAGVRELLTPTMLALSAARRLNDPDIAPFARQLADVAVRGLPSRAMRKAVDWRRLSYYTDQLFTEPDSSVHEDPELALALLRFADLGIEGVNVVDVALRFGDGTAKEVLLVHRVAGRNVSFALDDESEGTRTWYNLLGQVLHALRFGQVLLCDEIDASLHPKLSARLVELFQDPETNPRGAQLIFTTHDTSLLNHLNRDEVWLTEKGANGATTLTALAEYGGDKVRRSLNLEKAYLQGRFGAVPDVDQHLLRRALGLGTGTEG